MRPLAVLLLLALPACGDPCPQYMDGWEVGVEHGRDCVGEVEADGSPTFVGWGGGTYPAWCSYEHANRGYWTGYCEGENSRIHDGLGICGALGDEACLEAMGGME